MVCNDPTNCKSYHPERAASRAAKKSGTMLCPQCQTSLARSLGRPRRLADVASHATERLKTVLCEMCGDLLPPQDSTDRLLRTLSHLASFGLAAGGEPILDP
jgi:hypothetical protein